MPMAEGEIRVGTSGYSYVDWVGPFYPEGTRQSEFLAHYARFFDICEINYTYYRMPDPQTVAAMLQKSLGGVDFTFKLHRSITHEGDDAAACIRRFVAGIEPALAAGKVPAILAQFPNSFRPSREAWNRIGLLADALADVAPLVVEFRSVEWFRARFFDRLKRMGVGFCCVDEPRGEGLMPAVAIATGDVAYVRLHGRNRAKWWNHKSAEERYDYLYSADELEEWAAKIEELARSAARVLVFFNNHPGGKAVRNALELKRMLGV